ncbi:hypothetical protein GLOTRDRAFT_110331 [Gloeophyllum trabeum ATCC 11539]|uniref:Synaptobrevin n=1 Tax=Gloeophyllum trabeum (strain ATCC 11539 / FP-39264 / Madison 617) TaxID=670483 RepID=S7RQL7_GLOTA|nr:uncharacterized protein GLOTRDRAFT_110331 [Gloeophyllum trabeum ATCC 11539]EPQ56875.1 hypothetical protein GLOTRDRAFT_110331 [Gloeophyllum trabeum ATCC 11539]
MSFRSAEQSQHDKINLVRLVKRLDQSVSHDFEEGLGDNNGGEHPEKTEKYIRAQGAMQKVKYAQKLLRTPEIQAELQSQRRYDNFRTTLARLEATLEKTLKVLEPEPIRPEPILPTLPKPQVVTPLPTRLQSKDNFSTETAASPETVQKVLPAADLLLSPSEALPPEPDLSRTSLIAPPLPQSTLPSLPTSSTVPLQSSNLLHEELSAQLAQMATQLKANAVHFSSTLAKDQALVQETQEKLETNYNVMKKERVRVRDFRGKSGGTTCLVIFSVVAVLISFVVMVFIIRLTR